MFIVTPEVAEVKPATAADVFPLALRDAYQEIEADARDLFDEMTDVEIDAMAEEAALRDLADEGRFWM